MKTNCCAHCQTEPKKYAPLNPRLTFWLVLPRLCRQCWCTSKFVSSTHDSHLWWDVLSYMVICITIYGSCPNRIEWISRLGANCLHQHNGAFCLRNNHIPTTDKAKWVYKSYWSPHVTRSSELQARRCLYLVRSLRPGGWHVKNEPRVISMPPSTLVNNYCIARSHLMAAFIHPAISSHVF